MSLIFGGNYYDDSEIQYWYDKPIGRPFHNDDYSNALLMDSHIESQSKKDKDILHGLTKKQKAAVMRLVDKFKMQNARKI